MNSRERARRAITFGNPDRVPLLHGVLPAAIIRHGQPLVDLLYEFKDDFGGSWAVPDPKHLGPGYRGGTSTDEWGVVWKNDHEGMLGIPVGHPLADWGRFEGYQLPPIPDDSRYKSIQDGLVSRHEHYAMLGGLNLFERMQWLRGYEDLMYDIALGAAEAYRLRDALVDREVECLRKAVKMDVDGFHFGDDWGTQVALIISPDLWRRFYKPAYARMFQPCRSAGKDVHFHSDGVTWEILHDLVEVGVNVLNIQHTIMDLASIGREFGGKVAFRSDLDRQHILPHGTRDQIRTHVKEVVRTLGSYGGGLIGHGEIAPDVPLENVRAMFEAWREFGGQ